MAAADDTGVLYGSNAYNGIIFSRFDKNEVKDFNSTTRTSELVDIVSDYYWTIDKISKSADGGVIDVPHCYVVEYQQRYSSTITNLINSIVAAKNGISQTAGSVSDVISKVSALVKNLTDVGSQAVGNMQSSESSSSSTDAAPATTETSAQTQTGGDNSQTSTSTPTGGDNSQTSTTTPTTPEKTRGITREGESTSGSSNTSTNNTTTTTPTTNTATNTASTTATNTTTNTTTNTNNSSGGTVNSAITEMAKQLKDFYENHIGSKISNINNPVKDATTDGKKHYMQPYSLLYDLKATGTKYCFPMISEPPVLKAHNSFGDSQGDDTSILSLNSLFSNLSSLGNSIPAFGRDLAQINGFLSGSNSGELFERTHVEKAKFFQFPTDTDTYSVSFPLFNTVKDGNEPAWKKNYRFIVLFCMKNMIFRKDNVSFYPPLFYDLIIPGVIRQPYSYVEAIDIQPLGMVRIVKGENIFSFCNEQISIPVPEAWMVTIKFKSLIATSANLVLSGFTDVPTIAKSS